MIYLGRVVGFAFAFLVLGASASAFADGAAATPRDAATHFDRGVKLYEEQDWRAALIEFERAYEMTPHYRVLYDIAQCRYELRDYVGALGAFEKYLSQGGAEVPAPRRELAEAAILDLRGRVARVRVTADVEGAEVSVDDVVVGRTPLATPLLVSAGRRKIAATKPGRASAVRLVDVAGEDSLDVGLSLAPALPERTTQNVGGGGGRSMVPAIAAFGVAAGGFAFGTVFGLVAMQNKQDLDKTCQGRMCPADSQSLIDASERNAILSTVGFVTGAVGAGVGVAYLVLTSGGEGRASRAQWIRPLVGPGVLGASGSF